MTHQNAALALEDVFDLDLETTDLSTIGPGFADSEPCTGDNCGPSPTAGATSGCATPDSLAMGKGGGNGCNFA
ncbi:hypothetical protein [Streptomyces radicis]|uniref:Uncharacterized protein n=1 Tax=Streptomyces radicis TaxID=1750517 RepID=A0A3A9WBS7_9ACTN|nr:hypothetical protein [Streptomyces radicis]RKN10455.1 hypothetical protein D7319_08445 [Streptomyces radicis]RKN24714.1 hypothetical protein D7318_09620 [Streptomyces radicis]